MSSSRERHRSRSHSRSREQDVRRSRDGSLERRDRKRSRSRERHRSPSRERMDIKRSDSRDRSTDRHASRLSKDHDRQRRRSTSRERREKRHASNGTRSSREVEGRTKRSRDSNVSSEQAGEDKDNRKSSPRGEESPVNFDEMNFVDEEAEAERIRAESRKRRQAILEKYKKGPEAVASTAGSEPSRHQKGSLPGSAKDEEHARAPESLRFGSEESGPPSSLLKALPLDVNGSASCALAVPEASVSHPPLPPINGSGDAQPSHAPPTPHADAASSRGGDGVAANSVVLGSSASPDGREQADETFSVEKAGATQDPYGLPGADTARDMFSDDMFGDSPSLEAKQLHFEERLGTEVTGLMDNWDDAEGYYSFRVGEVLDGRYRVLSSHGRGVFSSVVRAIDILQQQGEGQEKNVPQKVEADAQNLPIEVAIKIIRNNETMFKAGQQELIILRKLAGADPDNRRHCVRLLSSFTFRSHLCLVFESMAMNLREVLKKFGRNIGLNLHAVRAYATQLFISLKHLRNCGVLHCDIKPDNMLVNDSKNVLKLADFGSAMFSGDNEITPYLVSRFYRAPEIMLGLPYGHALDMWSVGCCLYELFCGRMLFPGRTNNDMLRLHMELKGPFPKKMLKKAAFVEQHFDVNFNFCAIEEDPVTKKTMKRIISVVKPKDMASLLSGPGSSEEDPRALAAFKDLLDKMFVLDPDKRLTVSQALSHPFINTNSHHHSHSHRTH